MVRSWVAACIVSLLLLPGAAGQGAWHQHRGGAEKQSVIHADEYLDLLGTYELLPAGYTMQGHDGVPVLQTGLGFYLIGHPGPSDPADPDEPGFTPRECALFHMRALGDPPESRRTWPCSLPDSIQYYDADEDAMYICRSGGAEDPILSRYVVGPDEWTDIVTPMDVSAWREHPTAAGEVPYLSPRIFACGGGAFDEAAGELYLSGRVFTPGTDGQDSQLGLFGPSAHAVFAVDTRTAEVRSSPPLVISSLEPDAGMGPPRAVTLTDDHVFVTVLSPSLGYHVVWFDKLDLGRNGQETMLSPIARDLDVLRRDETWSLVAGGGAYYAVAREGHVAAMVAGRTTMLHPEVGAIWSVVPDDRRDDDLVLASSFALMWTRAGIVTPDLGRPSLRLVEGDSGVEDWRFRLDAPGDYIADAAQDADGDLYVIDDNYNRPGGIAVILVDGLAGSKQLRHVLPIPYSPAGSGWDADAREGFFTAAMQDQYGIQGLDDGQALVWSVLGMASLLGPAPVPPTISAADAYPAPGQPVRLEVSHEDGLTSFSVAWGDGEFRDARDHQASHVFDEPGTKRVIVSAVLQDNRTATGIIEIHVGATPPRDLTFLQEAFEPENYDLTFGVIGILVTAAGAAFAIWRLRRRRGTIRREINAIDAAVAQAEGPLRKDAALAERRARIQGLLLDGKLDESQAQFLVRHIDDLAKRARLESFGAHFDYLPHGFVRRLDEMLADGRISGWESDALHDLLDQAKITSTQRQAVRKTISQWVERDAAG